MSILPYGNRTHFLCTSGVPSAICCSRAFQPQQPPPRTKNRYFLTTFVPSYDLCTFPQGIRPLADNGFHTMGAQQREGWNRHYLEGEIGVDSNGSYFGSGTYDNRWNLAPAWTIFFCGRDDTPVTCLRTFAGDEENLTEYGESHRVSGTGRVGAVFSFEKSNVTSRVGLSYISKAEACHFVDSEIPAQTPRRNSNWGRKSAMEQPGFVQDSYQHNRSR